MTQAAAEVTQPSNDKPKQEAAAIPPSLWHEMDGAQVFIQLREGCEYISVTHPNNPVMKIAVRDAKGNLQPGGFTSDVGAEQQAAKVAAHNANAQPEEQLEFLAELLRTGALQGKLRVLHDAYGTMLMVERRDPLDESSAEERPKSVAKVMLAPDMVGFLSTVEQSLIR